MDVGLALKNKQHLDESQVLVAYNGYLSEKVLVSLADIIQQKLQFDQFGYTLTKRAFGLFCEQAQNVIRYSAERFAAGDDPSQEFGNGVVTVGYADAGVFVMCGNLIDKNHQVVVEKRLGELQEMDDKELRRYYKEKLKSESDPQSQGASVGLIEVVRRSTYPIEYDFIPYDDSKVFFCIKAYA